MTAVPQPSDELVVTIIARIGDKTYELGNCTVGSADEAMVKMPALLGDIAAALIAKGGY